MSNFHFKARFIEASRDSGVGPTKFKAILIQEGLGNLKDTFYYTKDALKNAIQLFEGVKIYADHPDALEEKTRPERSVRDIIGHYENVQYQESEDGRGMLVADAVPMPDEPYRWARALMREAVEYAKKYPTKDLIGVSINAEGDAEQKDLKDFLKEAKPPQSCLIKIQKALAEGVQSVRIVTSLKNAISADMVTEAGAGGKFQQILEKEKKLMKKEAEAKQAEGKEMEKKEGEMPPEEKKDGEEEAAPAPEAPKDGEHDDEAEDAELIQKMLKKHLGDAGIGEEEQSEEVMKHAQAAHEACKEMGLEGEEAMKQAAQAMKLAKHMAGKEAAKKEAEAKQAEAIESAKKESENKESAATVIVSLRGEIAKLKESLKRHEIAAHLEKKLSNSKLPVSVTKQFREAVGSPKSVEEIDKLFDLFKGGYESKGEAGSAAPQDFSSFVMTEKYVGTSKQAADFADCIED